MATFNEVLQQINAGANTTSVTARKSPMELMVMQQAMAQNSDAQTLMGLALGKLLRGLFDDWKERYDARGYLKVLANEDENKRKEMLEQLAKNDPRQYQITQDYFNKNGGTWDAWRKTPQSVSQPTADTAAPASDLSGINQNARPDWDKYKSLDDALNLARVGWGNGLRF